MSLRVTAHESEWEEKILQEMSNELLYDPYVLEFFEIM
jgi:hypothetical protein